MKQNPSKPKKKSPAKINRPVEKLLHVLDAEELFEYIEDYFNDLFKGMGSDVIEDVPENIKMDVEVAVVNLVYKVRPGLQGSPLKYPDPDKLKAEFENNKGCGYRMRLHSKTWFDDLVEGGVLKIRIGGYEKSVTYTEV